MDSLLIVMMAGTWLTALIAVGGVVTTWRRNNKTQAARDQSITDDLQSIAARLDDKNTGLGGLNKRLQTFEIHCATLSSAYQERLITAERDIKELKTKE